MKPQQIATIIMLVSLMLSAGLEINREHLMAVLKEYGLLARAIVANFILVPLFAVLIARLFHLDGYVAVGFLLMGIAPGVPFLVRAAGRQTGGSLSFAATLAFVMPALSIVTIPLTMVLVFPPEVAAQVPFAKVLTTLVLFQLLPLLIGLLIADRAPAVAAKLQRPLTLLFFLAIVVLLVLLGPTLFKDVAEVYGSRGIWATLVAVLLSIATGWFLGGPQPAYRRTLSIATALRNIGTCAVIATANFPDTLVTPMVLTYFLVQFIVTVIFRVIYHRAAAQTATA